MTNTYEKSGVSIEKGENLVDYIQSRTHATYNKNVINGIGGYCSVYALNDEKFLTAGCDGVGTKLKLAIDMDYYDDIGYDLVAMCVNDILCVGSQPLFFLDYFATSQLEVKQSESILTSIINACQSIGLPLIGGETAEMPGLYQKGDFDLAGFCVGEVEKKQLIDGSGLNKDVELIGIASSGFHSNGFSLIRQWTEGLTQQDKRDLLTGTLIYSDVVGKFLKQFPGHCVGLSHITGGGLKNIARMSNKWNYILDGWPDENERPKIITKLIEKQDISLREQFTTFNMGVGMVMAVTQTDRAIAFLQSHGFEAKRIGYIEAGVGSTLLKTAGEDLIF